MKKVHDAAGVRAEAKRFVQLLVPSKSCARVAVLSGDLGAGKTTFVQAMAGALGVEESVTSPTFVLEKIYALKGQAFERLIHIDAYRLNGAKELAALGWKELLEDPSNLVVLEWPERVPGAIPADAISIRFDIVDDGRIITIDGQGR